MYRVLCALWTATFAQTFRWYKNYLSCARRHSLCVEKNKNIQEKKRLSFALGLAAAACPHAFSHEGCLAFKLFKWSKGYFCKLLITQQQGWTHYSKHNCFIWLKWWQQLLHCCSAQQTAPCYLHRGGTGKLWHNNIKEILPNVPLHT